MDDLQNGPAEDTQAGEEPTAPAAEPASEPAPEAAPAE